MGYEVRIHVVREGSPQPLFIREDCPAECDGGWRYALDENGRIKTEGRTMDVYCSPIAMINLHNPGYSSEVYKKFADKKLNPNKDMKWSLNGDISDAYGQEYYPIKIADILPHLKQDAESSRDYIYFQVAYDLLRGFEKRSDFVVLWEGY